MKLASKDNSGFSLVELAVVMVVIGLLMGLGMSMVGPLMTSAKVRETKENIGATVESINSWASGNNKLPDVAGFTTAARSSTDAWGRSLIYLYDSALAPSTATKDTICGRKTTQITVQTIDPAATIRNVAFAILSQGDNPQTTAPSIFTTLDGVAVTASTGLSAPPNPRAIIVPANTDDLIRWVTLDELRSKVGCQGSQLKILNNELPPGTVSSPYPTISISVDGGATAANTYRWCIESTSASPLPAGLAFSTTTPALPVRVLPANNCSTFAEASWGVVNTSPYLLTISGTPAANMQGSYSFTISVRDNNDASGTNDNIASKAFVLTVNP